MSTTPQIPSVNSQFLAPSVLAKRWAFHPESVRRICRAGRLPTIKIGRRLRIPLHAIEALERELQLK